MKSIWVIILFFLGFHGIAQTFIKRTYYDELKQMPKEVISISKADSTLEGPFLSYYTSGSLQAEGYYHQDKTDSTWTFYFENGQKTKNREIRIWGQKLQLRFHRGSSGLSQDCYG